MPVNNDIQQEPFTPFNNLSMNLFDYTDNLDGFGEILYELSYLEYALQKYNPNLLLTAYELDDYFMNNALDLEISIYRYIIKQSTSAIQFKELTQEQLQAFLPSLTIVPISDISESLSLTTVRVIMDYNDTINESDKWKYNDTIITFLLDNKIPELIYINDYFAIFSTNPKNIII